MFASLPLMDDFLQQYRIQARRQIRRNLVGGHITRRIGQSLEFREYAPYYPGDDIRHVDWRATFRTHSGHAIRQPDNWLLRRYQSEERLQLLLSLDLRDTMHYPENPVRNQAPLLTSKAQIGRWLCAVLAVIALEERDGVVLHRLFGESQPPVEIRARDQIETLLNHIAVDDTAEHFNDTQLEQFLPPTAAWLIITDFYFTEANALIERVASAPNWVIFVELDSWPAERAAIQTGARLVDGPLSAQKRVNVTAERLQEVEARIAQNRRDVLESCPRADYTRWVWPVEATFDVEAFFRARFAEDMVLQRLFMKDA